jgi:CheY-like chemotaxis protein
MPKSVLIIEDNPDNRMIFCMILRHNGYEIIEAMDGETGIQLASSELPDMIVLDIGLPGIDGWEVCRRLRGDARTHAIPTVAATAHTSREDRAQSFRSGFDAVLTKPVPPGDLVSIVRKYIGGP